jgi:hypothetical protein
MRNVAFKSVAFGSGGKTPAAGRNDTRYRFKSIICRTCPASDYLALLSRGITSAETEAFVSRSGSALATPKLNTSPVFAVT